MGEDRILQLLLINRLNKITQLMFLKGQEILLNY
jgi:hypothetical protein